MAKKNPLPELVRDAVDRGATTVEEIHKAIADLPLEVLEQIEGLEKPARRVREIQEQSIGAVYDLIRTINRKVGALADDLIETGREAAGRKARRPAAKARGGAAKKKGGAGKPRKAAKAR